MEEDHSVITVVFFWSHPSRYSDNGYPPFPFSSSFFPLKSAYLFAYTALYLLAGRTGVETNHTTGKSMVFFTVIIP